MHQKYINQHPLRDIDGRLSREAHEGALQKAAHNYW